MRFPAFALQSPAIDSHAGELVALAGVQLRPYVEVRQKFHELLADYKPRYEVKDTKERPYVQRKGSDGSDDNQGGSGDETPQGGGDDNGDNE